MSGSDLAYTARVFNEDLVVKRLIAASDDALRRSRRVIEDLTVVGELLSTMIEASDNMIGKWGRDVASSHQPERNRVINKTIPGPPYFTPSSGDLSVLQGTNTLRNSRLNIYERSGTI